MLYLVQPTLTEEEYAHLASLVHAELAARLGVREARAAELLANYELTLEKLEALLQKFIVGMTAL